MFERDCLFPPFALEVEKGTVKEAPRSALDAKQGLCFSFQVEE